MLEVGQLVRDARNQRSDAYKTRLNRTQQTQQMLNEAVATAHETYETVLRVERDVLVTERIGERTVEQLQHQREVLTEVNVNLDAMPAHLRRAKIEIAVIVRNLSRDRVFMVLCFLVTIALVGAIVVFSRKHLSGGGGGEELATTAPDATSRPAGFR